jgi:hypothetical protein
MNKLAGRREVVKVSYTPPQWEREARGWRHNPSIVLVLVVFALVWLLANFYLPTTTAGGREAEHRMVPPACAEAARLRAHGATTSAWYARVRSACARSGGP